MSNLQPLVRSILTFAVAAMAAIIATVDDETVRIVCGALLAGFGAVGVVPPHIPTTTSIPEQEQVNVLREQGGYGVVEALLVVFLAVVILVVLFRLL